MQEQAQKSSLNPFDIRASVRTSQAVAVKVSSSVSIPLISGHQSGPEARAALTMDDVSQSL